MLWSEFEEVEVQVAGDCDGSCWMLGEYGVDGDL